MTPRVATAADASMLAAVLRAAFEEQRGVLHPPSGAHAETTESVLNALGEGEGGAFVAEEGGEIVG